MTSIATRYILKLKDFKQITMNNDNLITRAFNRFKSVNLPENIHITKEELKPLEATKRTRTVYPNGAKQMSLDGITEFYGLQEK